jgi:type IV pilus assembly protein PilB
VIATLPTVEGESAVMRPARTSRAGAPTLEELGLLGRDARAASRDRLAPDRALSRHGTDGLRKSTTLVRVAVGDQSARGEHHHGRGSGRSTGSTGINQVQINIRAGLTFAARCGRSCAPDPDVVMVGEIRDGETAKISIEAALTGHLVLSTLHTNDAPGA